MKARASSVLALFAVGVLVASGAVIVEGARPAVAEVTAVKGTACGYYVNLGLFGGPQNLRGCDQTAGGEASESPKVSLPPEGSASPITATDPDGAAAKYGPATAGGGLWPENVATAPPSGPLFVSTEGTLGPNGSVHSIAETRLRPEPYPEVACAPGFSPPCVDPGGFGGPPVWGDSVHAECTASEDSVTGSTTFSNAFMAHATDLAGEPLASETEAIPENPPANYTLHGTVTNVGDVFSVVFNEHIVHPDGSLTVNGIHVYLFGPVAVGELVRGQVTCGTTPTAASAEDVVAPGCGIPVVAPMSPQDPTPRVPRTELIGVFDTGGIQSIDNVQVTNGTVDVGQPEGFPYLRFNSGQTGPLPITAVRTDDAEAADLPMTWSFEATDTAGNTTSSSECPTGGAGSGGSSSGGSRSGAGAGAASGPGVGSASGTGGGSASGTGGGSGAGEGGSGSGSGAGSGSGTQTTTARAATGTTGAGSPSGSGTTATGRSLATTGRDVLGLTVSALAIVLLGAFAVRRVRSRIRPPEQPPGDGS